ncbi:MAG TPA: tetratricopeptide repeat protein [Phenylobacterium sp.]|nr:tetratricopeptide repeat protein [Phenylobacterium sp.]
MRDIRYLRPFAAAAALVAFALPARAAVTVLGGDMAHQCSIAALAGQSDEMAEAKCTMALDGEFLSPRDRAGTFVNRGVLKLRRKDFTAAQGDFDRAIEAEPKMGEAYVNRGAAAVGVRRYAQGVADINKALQLGVEEPEKAYYNRALAYEGLDDMKAAYFDYQKALELKPDWDQPKKELSRFTVERR